MVVCLTAESLFPSLNETDWKLCELIARIQYATQQHFFGVMAEKYFDDMNSDVQFTGKRHRQRSVDGYNRLPQIFTREDVIKAFGNNNKTFVSMKLSRLEKDQYICKIEDGDDAGKFKKMKAMS